MNKPNPITPADTLLVILIACGVEDCKNYEYNEEQSGDAEYCAETFYEGGWRKCNDKIYCPDCSANLKIE